MILHAVTTGEMRSPKGALGPVASLWRDEAVAQAEAERINEGLPPEPHCVHWKVLPIELDRGAE